MLSSGPVRFVMHRCLDSGAEFQLYEADFITIVSKFLTLLTVLTFVVQVKAGEQGLVSSIVLNVVQHCQEVKEEFQSSTYVREEPSCKCIRYGCRDIQKTPWGWARCQCRSDVCPAA